MHHFLRRVKPERADMNIPKISPGDILELKKIHPCGAKKFSVVRVGSDIRLICSGCGRDITIPREKLEKSIKKIIHMEGDNERDR